MSCSTVSPKPPVVNVTAFRVVMPDEELLKDCAQWPKLPTIGSELERLADLVQCERDNNQALREWYERLMTEPPA